MELGIVKDTFEIVSKMFELIKNGFVDNANSRKEFFSNHIDSSFQRMELIHTDYVKNFTKLINIKDKKDVTTNELIEWLKNCKIEHQTVRDRISKIETEIFNNTYFSKSFKRNSEISKWTQTYLTDIMNYFNFGFSIDKMTWYSFLINCLEMSLVDQLKQSNNLPVGLNFAVVKKPGVFKTLSGTIDVLNTQFKYIQESYSKLRAMCLK